MSKFSLVLVASTCILPSQILNTKVIFRAQVTKGSTAIGDLIFDRVDINIGGGFDGPGGVHI